MYLSIEDNTLFPYAMDGYPIPKSNLAEMDSLTLDDGSRAEFRVKFNRPGTYKFIRGGWNANITGNEACKKAFGLDVETCIGYDKDTDVALIVVLDEEVETDPDVKDWDPIADVDDEMDPHLSNLLSLPLVKSREVTL